MIMKKYYLYIPLLLLLLLLSLNVSLAQIIIRRDLIKSNIDSTRFEMKITDRGDTLFVFVPIENQLVPASDAEKISVARLIPSTNTENPSSRAVHPSNIPTTVTLDKSKDVGDIPIESNTINGSVTYNIPIEVYPSAKGFQPTVSLSYNSMGDNGVAGYGWNIGGMSMISITHSNYYYDEDYAQGARVDRSSAYSLDGQRLITTRGMSEYIYQTVQGHIKVINNAKYGKYYFDVYYPDGRKAVYGYKTSTVAKPFYPLTRLEDNFGNYIEYSYTESSNLVYPTEIKYGKTTTPLGSIRFTYQDRTDARTTYFAGLALKQDKLLTKVETYYLSTLLKTYSLTYEPNLYNFLTKVDCIADAKQFNPLLFYYGEEQITENFETSTTLLESYFSHSEVSDQILKKGKFNNLAVSDGLVVYPNFSTFGVIAHSESGISAKFGSTYSETQNLLVYKNLGSYSSVPVKIQTGPGFQSLDPADIDGDGNDELVRVNYYYDDTKRRPILDITTYDKNMTANNSTHWLDETFSYGSCYNAMPRTFLTGDFNGDGKMELLAISGNKTPTNERKETKTIIMDLESRTKLYNQNFIDYNYFEDFIFALDHNGDGKTDICLINKDGTFVYTFHNGVLSQIANTPLLTNKELSSSPERRQLLVGDMNGDGLIDLLISPSASSVTRVNHIGQCQGVCGTTSPSVSPDGSILIYQNGSKYCQVRKEPVIAYATDAFDWKFFYSTGNGFAIETKKLTDAANEHNKEFIIQDINGDGLPDFIIRSDTQISAYLNKNGVISTTAEPARVIVDKDAFFISGVVKNGFGYRSSQLLSIKDMIVTPITFTRNDARQRMLTGVINSSGILNRLRYESLTAENAYQITNSQISYPYIKLYTDFNVVSRSDVYNGNMIVGSSSFNYQDAVIHSQGLGFCGFQKIRTTDNIRNTTLTQIFDPTTFGILKSMDSPTVSGTYNYNVNIADNKIISLTIANKTEKDKLKDVTVTSTYSYDIYNNPLTEITNFGGGLKTTVNRKYNNLTDTMYKIGELYDETTINERGGEIWSNRKYISDIDATSRLPKVVLTYANGNQTSETNYTYSSDNITEKSIKNYRATTGLITKYEYDTYDRISRKIDPLGFYVDYGYNAKGLLSSKKNQKGLGTIYEYDSWGRNIKTTSSDGTTEITTLSWVNNNSTSGGSGSGFVGYKEAIILSSKVSQGTVVIACKTITLQPGFSFAAASGNSMSLALNRDLCTPLPQGGVGGNVSYMVTRSVTGQPDTQTYFDALGREIRTGQKRFDGRYLYTDKVYDNKGQLEKTSLPFKDSPTLWNTYAYDTYGRITYQAYASGKKDTYSYDKNKVTARVDNITKTTSYDATGQVINVVDPAGTITYKYRPDGQPSSIIAPGNVITSFEYDGYGRQIKLIDPSAGTKIFAYDISGNLTRETDANSKITNIIYDVYNRVKSKEIVGELTTVYAYNVDGQVDSITSDNATSKTFTYDNFMRLISEKDSVADGKYLQKTYTYANGNIASVSYASNLGSIVTENNVFTNGHLTEIKLNNTTSIWKLTEENALGLPTSTITGSLTRTYGYDSFGLPTVRSVENGTDTLQNFGYGFNTQTGNLTWRKDNNRNIQENFAYDNLNRLTTFNGKTITYDIKGNITNHTTVGLFEYNQAGKPYAVSDITPYGKEIAQRLQTITYNGLMRPVTIAENNYTASFIYNADGDRVKMLLNKGTANELTRYYIGGQYECDNGVAGAQERLYLDGDAYSAAAVYVKEGSGAWTVNYICRDYLGSISHVTDAIGNLRQELSYDPWGRLRNPANQALYASDAAPTLLFGRGYTGHEHLAIFGLINMNARLYDPVVGRFLSPDPYVQAPDFSQNFNRYSYALNNPLRYTDASGEFMNIVIAGLVSGVYNLGMQGAKGQIHSLKDGLLSFGVGALAGALGERVRNSVGGVGFFSGATSGALGGFTSGAILEAGNAWISGSSFTQGLGAGLKGGLTGAVIGAIVEGAFSGINSTNHGGNFFTGKGYSTTSEIFSSGLGGNKKLNQGWLMDFKDELDWTPTKYGISKMEVGMDLGNVYEKTPYFTGTDGIIYKLYDDGLALPLGGITTQRSEGIFKSYSEIFLSVHQAKNGLKLSLNHELIHAYHYSLGLNMSNTSYSEYSAYSYSASFPSTNQALFQSRLTGRYKWYTSAKLLGYGWPSYLLPM